MQMKPLFVREKLRFMDLLTDGADTVLLSRLIEHLGGHTVKQLIDMRPMSVARKGNTKNQLIDGIVYSTDMPRIAGCHCCQCEGADDDALETMTDTTTTTATGKERLYKCEYCARAYTSPGRLANHLKTCGSDAVKGKVPCRFCGNLFVAPGGLKRHMNFCKESPKKQDEAANAQSAIQALVTNQQSATPPYTNPPTSAGNQYINTPDEKITLSAATLAALSASMQPPSSFISRVTHKIIPSFMYHGQHPTPPPIAQPAKSMYVGCGSVPIYSAPTSAAQPAGPTTTPVTTPVITRIPAALPTPAHTAIPTPIHATYPNDIPNAPYNTPPAVVKAPPRKKAPIPKALKIQVWNCYVGKEVGACKCPLCQHVDIQQGDMSSWHASHVIPESAGGPTNIGNLRVACKNCNTSMSTRHMREYCQAHYADAIPRLHI